MSKKKTVVIHEFGVLCGERAPVSRSDAVSIPQTSFDNLWKFILENKDEDVDKVMSVHSRGGKRFIKTGRYVGTIQTKDGQTIEILPKIYKSENREEDDVKLCRRVFLRMLATLRRSDAQTFQDASLEARKNFPILEVYISRYLSEVEQLLVSGIKKNYMLVKENQKFLKGKLLVHKQITKNCSDKTKFAIRYSKYIEDIPQNRLIVSTLCKLSGISRNSLNTARCYSLLSILSEIPQSKNIEGDLQVAMRSNRLFATYENLLQWSSQFLLNKGFTTFSGTYVNQSLLFSAEKLFENFVARLFKKYAKDYIVKSQHHKYFLVDKHGDSGRGKFRLRPDIVAETRETENFANSDMVIVDTKWKNIDANVPEDNYLIDIKDMYQLFAYGQKYHQGENYFLDVIPKLVLVYPYTEKFQTPLKPFYYEEIKARFGLKLMVFPFNLADDSEGYKRQIGEIMTSASCLEDSGSLAEKKQTQIFENPSDILTEDYLLNSGDKYMLVGYYRKGAHLDWILKNKIYNVRLNPEREGALKGVDLQITPSRILLYNNLKDDVRIFTVNQSEVLIAGKEKMESLNCPFKDDNHDKTYKLFSLGQEITQHKKVDILKLKSEQDIKNADYTPFFVKF